MLDKNSEELLYQIFYDIDEMCRVLDNQSRLSSGESVRNRPQMRMSESELMTILCFYHYSGYKCFEYYYERMVLGELHGFFPDAVGYRRFVQLIPRTSQRLYLFAKLLCERSERAGIFFADSKKLPVCDNRRIHSNQVFEGVAGRGKSSTGWFYGLKLHLIVNNLGEIVRFQFTAANVADNNKNVLDKLLGGLKGKCFADKGYLTKHFEHFLQQGIQVVTKVRKNMKNALMSLHDKVWLKKRALIESINDLLMSVFDIDHSRHRSPWNAITHAIAGVAAYAYYPQKPAAFIKLEVK